MSLVGGWKTASFLVGSESNVRHWGPLPAGPVHPSGSKGQEVITSSKGKKQENKKEEARTRSNSRRPGPSLRALLFGCGAGAVLGQTARFSCRFRKPR